jgi:putative endonuclease
MMFYTYVLESKKDGNLYYGYTHDLTQRFEQHTKGLVESTAYRRPPKLVYYEACISKHDALQRERYFKSYRGRQFLYKRLKSYFTGSASMSLKAKSFNKNEIT